MAITFSLTHLYVPVAVVDQPLATVTVGRPVPAVRVGNRGQAVFLRMVKAVLVL
jgi:hypothetical protein